MLNHESRKVCKHFFILEMSSNGFGEVKTVYLTDVIKQRYDEFKETLHELKNTKIGKPANEDCGIVFYVVGALVGGFIGFVVGFGYGRL